MLRTWAVGALAIGVSGSGCDSADVREGDAGPSDAGGPVVLFEESFDDDDVSSRWTTETPGTELIFADGVATSPTSCDAYAGCPEGPAVARSLAVIELTDEQPLLTFEIDFLLADNGMGISQSSVVFSLGVVGSVPRLETDCGIGTARCWHGFEFLFRTQIRVPTDIVLEPLLVDAESPEPRLYRPDPVLRTGQWYRARVSLCGLDGVRMQVFDGERALVDQHDGTFVIGFPTRAWQRLNVYIQGQGIGHQLDDIRITSGASCD